MLIYLFAFVYLEKNGFKNNNNNNKKNTRGKESSGNLNFLAFIICFLLLNIVFILFFFLFFLKTNFLLIGTDWNELILMILSERKSQKTILLTMLSDVSDFRVQSQSQDSMKLQWNSQTFHCFNSICIHS